MKVIVAIDESPFSEHVVERVAQRHWPADTQFKILTVIEPVALEEFGKGKWAKVISEVVARRRELAQHLCSRVRQQLEEKIPDSIVHYEIREGRPREEILEAAVEWSADRIVIGAHGRGASAHGLMGSVSKTVAAHAPCTVEVVRPRSATRKPTTGSAKTTAQAVVNS